MVEQHDVGHWRCPGVCSREDDIDGTYRARDVIPGVVSGILLVWRTTSTWLLMLVSRIEQEGKAKAG